MDEKKSLFKKIKYFIKRIFKRKDIKLLKEGSAKNVELEENIIKKEEKNFEFIPENNQKKDFFNLYDDIKNGKTKMEELSTFDLIRVNVMLKEEGKMLDEKKESLRNIE